MARIPAAERRAELVAAAVRVIAAHGVDGATTRRIAEEANAPLATLHYCFSSKEVLFAAVFEYVTAQYREVLTRNDVHGGVPPRRVPCCVVGWSGTWRVRTSARRSSS